MALDMLGSLDSKLGRKVVVVESKLAFINIPPLSQLFWLETAETYLIEYLCNIIK